QIFTLRQIFEKAWEYTKEVYACFVDLEKAYDLVPRNKLWGVLEEYEINGQLLAAIKSLYKCPKVCVRVNGIKSRSFTVGVGLRQGCVLSPLLFIIYMNWIDMRSRGGVGVEVGNCRVSHLLFADDMVLLCSSKNHLQHALDRFATECCNAGMKISTAKSETFVLSRNPAQCTLHVSGATLKQVERFKSLGITFTSDGKSDGELDARIGGAGAVLHQLRRSVVIKRELGVKAKLAIFNSVFIPILTYGHEFWIMTERMRSRVQAAEMGFLRSVAGLSLLDRVHSTAIREFLSSEPLLLRIERSQLRWYGDVIRMSDDRIARRVLLAEPMGRRPRGRPRTRWLDYINNLVWSRLGIPPQHLQEVASDRSH
ncbi:RNA-directed DNA polymerase, partial [Fusobacterium pseudoperiodonticum]